MSVKNSTGLLAFVTTVGLIGAVGYVATTFSNKIIKNRDDAVVVAASEVAAKVAAAQVEEPKQEPVPDIVADEKERQLQKEEPPIIDEYTPRQPVIEEEKVLNKRLKEVEDAERVEKEFERKAKAQPVKADAAPLKSKVERKSVTRTLIAKLKPRRPAWLKPKPREKKPTVIVTKRVPTQPIRPRREFEEERFDPFFLPKFFFGALAAGFGTIVDMKQKMLGLDVH